MGCCKRLQESPPSVLQDSSAAALVKEICMAMANDILKNSDIYGK
jgi:hypothetical protein